MIINKSIDSIVLEQVENRNYFRINNFQFLLSKKIVHKCFEIITVKIMVISILELAHVVYVLMVSLEHIVIKEIQLVIVEISLPIQHRIHQHK
jgi:hypothetical protein